jgi:hypothetical protein
MMKSRAAAIASIRPRAAMASRALAATFVLLAASFVSPLGASGGEAPLTISGTVQYNGSQGPVSAAKPIVLFATRSRVFDGIPVDLGVVETNGGSFELTMPEPGEYYLAYLLDTNGDAIPALGDPYGIYENRLNAPGDPITVPVNEAQSNLELVFDDTVSLPGVFGTVTYTGSMGPVSDTRPIRVQVFREGDLTDRVDRQQRLVNNGDSYSFILLESRLHYMQVFLDLNDDDVLDPGEPFEIYPDRYMPPGDPLPQGIAEVDVDFGDAPPTPTPIEGPTLSGTIEYTGSLGPVSGERPILLFLLPSENLDGPPVSATFVDTNGGAFELAAPEPGEYYLGYLLDTNGDTAPAVGDPFELYLDHTTLPADPVTVPQSGLALSFDDSGTLPGIQGTATYTGNLGPVSSSMPILVDVYRDADLTDRLDQQSLVTRNGDPFDFILLEGVDHYMMAFLDLNRNDVRDEGEPFTIYNGRTAPPGDPVPQDGSMVNLSFGELPTPTPTPLVIACVGDCNGDGEVTIDELILGVRIALEMSDLSDCPEFDADGSEEVTVDELVEAVNNALSGCPET